MATKPQTQKKENVMADKNKQKGAAKVNKTKKLPPPEEPKAEEPKAVYSQEALDSFRNDRACNPKHFGLYDGDSPSCQECNEIDSECAAACQHVSKGNKNGKASPTIHTPRATNKVLSNFGHGADTGAGKLDVLLHEGATMEQLIERSGRKRNAVMAHIQHLRTAHGAKIFLDKGVYKFVS